MEEVWDILNQRTQVPTWGGVMMMLDMLGGGQDLTAGSAIHLLKNWVALTEVMERISEAKNQGKALCCLVSKFRDDVLRPISRRVNDEAGSSFSYKDALALPFGAKIGGSNEGSGACACLGSQNFPPSFMRARG